MRREFKLITESGNVITCICYGKILNIELNKGLASLDIDGLSDEDVVKRFNDVFEMLGLKSRMYKNEK